MKKIPVVRFQIDERNSMTGVKTMSIVDEPAIESNFIAFSKDAKPDTLELIDLAKKDKKYKNVLAGLALIPNKKILRFKEDQPYYGVFKEEDVETIRNKFHKEQMTGRVNVEHNSKDYINAYMIESFIVDTEERLADVKAKGITEVTLGSWWVAYKIEDDKTFQKALSKELNGFSVEIYLSKMYEEAMNEDNNKINKLESEMNRLKTLVEQFAKAKEVKVEEVPAVTEAKKFERAKVAGEETIFEYTEEGQPAFVVKVAEDGTETQEQAPEGDHKLDNGKVVSVGADGIASAIKDAEEEKPVEQEKQAEVAVEKQSVDTTKAELEKAQAEIKKLKTDLQAAQAEAVKLKKEKPLAVPVTKTVPVQQKNFSAMTTKERLFAKHGVTE